jgi:hypothetical protein
MYGISARQTLGATLRSSYNTFLNQGCRLLIINPTSSSVNASINMVRYDGTQVLTAQTLGVPAHGLADYDLCGQEKPNNYGVATVQPSTLNSLVSSVVRLGQNDDYRFPTPVRQ